MNDIRSADAVVECFHKLIERFGGIAFAGFDLDWVDLWLELTAVGNQKIDLNIVTVLLIVVARVEEQGIAVADQLLCNRVLEDHTLVDRQIVVKNRLIQLTIGDLRLRKSVADQEPGIAHITLYIGSVLVE